MLSKSDIAKMSKKELTDMLVNSLTTIDFLSDMISEKNNMVVELQNKNSDLNEKIESLQFSHGLTDFALEVAHDSIERLVNESEEKQCMINELSEMVEDYKNQCIELQESNDSLRFTVDYLKQKNSDLEDIIIRDNEISDYYNNLISDMEVEITDLNNQIIEEQNRYDNLDNAYEVIYNKLSYYRNEYETIIVPDKINAIQKKYDSMVETAKSIIDEKNSKINELNEENKRLTEVKNQYKKLYRQTLKND